MTVEEQIREIKREIALRQVAYPKLVANGKLKKEKAEYLIDTMRAVLVSLEKYEALLKAMP